MHVGWHAVYRLSQSETTRIRRRVSANFVVREYVSLRAEGDSQLGSSYTKHSIVETRHPLRCKRA